MYRENILFDTEDNFVDLIEKYKSSVSSALSGAKRIRFFDICGVSARTREEGVELVRTFFGKGG